ncbi:MAG: adenosylcobinamide amidohydrolase [Alphaproteobacteria bacterium]
MRPELRPPWLLLDFGQDLRVLGWPAVGPALGTARRVAWLQVRNTDLPPDRDPAVYFTERARAAGVSFDAGLMTAAELRGFAVARRVTGDTPVSVIATGGLGNAESAVPFASEPREAAQVGTINVVAVITRPLALAAQVEAVSIVAEARTAAVMGFGLTMMEDGRPVTGTGTDCILVAAPADETGLAHCGLHTPIGRALAEATYESVRDTCASCLRAPSLR